MEQDKLTTNKKKEQREQKCVVVLVVILRCVSVCVEEEGRYRGREGGRGLTDVRNGKKNKSAQQKNWR